MKKPDLRETAQSYLAEEAAEITEHPTLEELRARSDETLEHLVICRECSQRLIIDDEELPAGAALSRCRCVSCAKVTSAQTASSHPPGWRMDEFRSGRCTYSKELIEVADRLLPDSNHLAWICPNCKCSCGTCDNCIPF